MYNKKNQINTSTFDYLDSIIYNSFHFITQKGRIEGDITCD